MAVFGVMVNKLHRKGIVSDSFSCLRCCSATTVYWDKSIDMRTGVGSFKQNKGQCATLLAADDDVREELLDPEGYEQRAQSLLQLLRGP